MPRIRTGFSFNAAVGKLPDVMKRILECGYPVAPIMDRASTFGWTKWSKLCLKNSIRPIFGIELAVTSSLNSKKINLDYWTFIAKDDIHFINKLFEMATIQHRHEPLLTYEQAMNAEGVFKIVGYRSSLSEILPKDLIEPDVRDLYIGLSPSCSKGYVKRALDLGFKFVACSDNKYPTNSKIDKILYETICGRGSSTQSYDQFIQTDLEWDKSVSYIVSLEERAKAIANRALIFLGSTAQLKKGTLLVPEKPKSLYDMCIEGARKVGCPIGIEAYKLRLEYELGMIKSKNFEDYFYIISDLCKWARERMLMGPARGSSCGSLACFLLEITTVDPIPYGLIFERFIDVNRADLPDIDLDFSDERRHLAFEYMIEKYGAERVSRLGAVSTYGPDASLNTAGAALDVPKWKCDAVAESLLKRSSGDARALDSLEDTFKAMPAGRDLIKEFPEMLIVTKMEGHPSHYTQHAAGILLTQEPINHYVAIDRRTGAVQCDKKDAEDLNLLKIDALGLTQLSVFEQALELAKLPRLALESIPMNDPEAFEVLNKGKFCGVFQFNGIALQSITKQFTMDCLDDIISVTALARPGPMASGGSSEWVERRNKRKPVTYPHAMFEPDLKDTLGIVLYQEQVMNIGRNVGDLSWDDVTQLRKSMSKSLGKEYFNQWGDKWKAGAIAKGGDPKAMDKVWDDLCSYGSWSFNKSHAVAYGIISYQCCWMKAHYPFEFAAATLTHEKKPEKQLQLLREIVDEGYDYIPVDAKISSDKWEIGYKDGKKILIGPLTNIKGIGAKSISAILSARARGEKLPNKAEKLLANPVTSIDSLFPIRDAFKRVMPDPAARNIHTQPTKIKDIVIKEDDYDVLIFCIFTKINPRDENEAVKIAKRGGKRFEGSQTASLNLYATDDSDTIFMKVSRRDYDEIGKQVVDRGRPGKCLYAVKARIWAGGGSFRMGFVQNLRYIGELVEEKVKTEKLSSQ